MFLVVFFKEFAIFHLCKQKDEFLKREHQRFHAIVISSQCPKLTNITHNVQNLSITKYFTMLFEKTSHNCINFIHCTVSIQYNLSYLHTFQAPTKSRKTSKIVKKCQKPSKNTKKIWITQIPIKKHHGETRQCNGKPWGTSKK